MGAARIDQHLKLLQQAEYQQQLELRVGVAAAQLAIALSAVAEHTTPELLATRVAESNPTAEYKPEDFLTTDELRFWPVATSIVGTIFDAAQDEIIHRSKHPIKAKWLKWHTLRRARSGKDAAANMHGWPPDEA